MTGPFSPTVLTEQTASGSVRIRRDLPYVASLMPRTGRNPRVRPLAVGTTAAVLAGLMASLGAPTAASAAVPTLERVALDPPSPTGRSAFQALSRNGRWLAFTYASAGDATPGSFLRDLSTGATTPLAAGVVVAVSDDGKRLALQTDQQLVASDSDTVWDGYVVGVGPAAPAPVRIGPSRLAMNASGRYVAYVDYAGGAGIKVRDLTTGTEARVDVAPEGGLIGSSTVVSLSGDGRVVAFASTAPMPGDSTSFEPPERVYVRDLEATRAERLSTYLGDADSWRWKAWWPAALDADGSVVSWIEQRDGSSGDEAVQRVIVVDRDAGTREVANARSDGTVLANGYDPLLSSEGRYVGFGSFDDGLVADDDNEYRDGYIRDRWAAQTERVTVSATGAQSPKGGTVVAISGDGLTVLFTTSADGLVPDDTNGASDLFIRRYPAGTGSPQTTITSGPSGTTRDTTPTYRFSSARTDTRFQCRIDIGVWKSCATGWTPRLADGRRVIAVRAVDAGGRIDPTPSTRTITVDSRGRPPRPGDRSATPGAAAQQVLNDLREPGSSSWLQPGHKSGHTGLRDRVPGL